MLTQMRALSQNVFGRAIMAMVLGVMILAFAVWGIGDRFTNFNADQLAAVGSTKITVQDFRNAYQNELQQLQEKAKRGITNTEARRMGVDREVLSRLLSNAILDHEAGKLGLAVGDGEIAQAITQDRMFFNPNGQFDRDRFNLLLSENNMSEGTYVRSQRGLMMRRDVSDAVVGGIEVPQILKATIFRYQSEVRDLTFFTLPASAAGAVPAPTQTQLQQFYDERPTAFTAPEYRKLVVLSVVPANLVKPDAVSDADARKRYDDYKDTLYRIAERRTVDQVFFPDEAAAKAARDSLDKGQSFADLLKSQKKTEADVSLGTVTKDQIPDKALADAAFSLPEGGTSQPVKTPFGTVLIHVAKIEPGRTRSFDEAKGEIDNQLAIIRAKAQADKLREDIENQRAAGKTLAESAKAAGVTPRTIDAIDAQGFDKAHKPVEGLVDGPALLKAAFGADVGADTEYLQAPGGGTVWYEVLGVDAAHKLPLAEVKPRVEAMWKADETARRLAKASEAIVAEINGGKPIAAVAAAHGDLKLYKATDLSRAGAPQLPSSVANAAFGVVVGKAGATPMPGGDRLIFKVDAARAPPLKPGDEQFDKLMGQVKGGIVDDVLAEYLSEAQHEIGVKLNERALQSALSDDSSS
ncbi:Peptidylprolyl isomerase [Beijerinckiaceae bacterium RH AL1]|nr:SurA N-terminal domain-containing protein [Beijerinckiaceae bacterium]VVB45475.1 Peptidylprolyl isomerase [Beijerinckiaceae bacterium RH CH11]VVB45552.1 Peptidylprolyl isomerase [Beijerinckiaceae bacterium RH AL8]VVC54884.1 Peptidylprolyl isomerase [Beijerinckiaceae bacterium RH AL1]